MFLFLGLSTASSDNETTEHKQKGWVYHWSLPPTKSLSANGKFCLMWNENSPGNTQQKRSLTFSLEMILQCTVNLYGEKPPTVGVFPYLLPLMRMLSSLWISKLTEAMEEIGSHNFHKFICETLGTASSCGCLLLWNLWRRNCRIHGCHVDSSEKKSLNISFDFCTPNFH